MRIKNDQAGLTLVELLVTIVVASIVTLAACTMLLFGLRINNQSTKTSRGQNTVQVLMEALEDVAAEAKDLEIESDLESWKIKGTVIEGENTVSKVFFSYISTEQTIYSGATTVVEGKIVGTPFLNGIFASSVSYKNQLLTIDVQTEQGNYSTKIYCRQGKTDEKPEKSFEEKLIDHLKAPTENALPAGITIATEGKQLNFIQKLASQYGSRGEIIGEGEKTTYFSEWYLGEGGYSANPSWNKNTPWCACFVSWGMSGIASIPKKANVEDLKAEFRANWKIPTPEVQPASGDLVFFNFDDDAESDHVGVVIGLTEDSKYIYTIEGNSAGQVAVRKYEKNDGRILGYGYFVN